MLLLLCTYIQKGYYANVLVFQLIQFLSRLYRATDVYRITAHSTT